MPDQTELPDQTDRLSPRSTGADQPTAFSTLVSSRRVLFHRAGLAALAGGGALALAACSDDSPSATPSAAPSSAAASPSASASASESASSSPSASASASESASSEPEGTKVAASSVPVGGGAVLSDADYVVTQPTKGEYKAFTKICTHQGCPVASVTDGEIVCDCHGSHFSITDGSPVSGPAKAALAAKKVVASGSNVYVSG